jgi:NADH pyrophosphatase NudC (nudix superfamily)
MYLGVIPDDAEFARQESEVDDIRWFDIDGIEKYIAEEWMVSRIKKISSLK